MEKGYRRRLFLFPSFECNGYNFTVCKLLSEIVFGPRVPSPFSCLVASFPEVSSCQDKSTSAPSQLRNFIIVLPKRGERERVRRGEREREREKEKERERERERERESKREQASKREQVSKRGREYKERETEEVEDMKKKDY